MREAKPGLEWQSKAILLIVVPWTAISVLLQSYWWAREAPVVVWTSLGISGVFGLVVWRMRAGTLAAAATGAAITASLMFSTTRYPYEYSWLHGGLLPLLAVFLLTFAATKIGKSKKENLGTGEGKRGRNAAQVAANLGVAALMAQILKIGETNSWNSMAAFLATAALAEAAADTVSSEIGQVLGGQPRMVTTFQSVEPGTDGGVTTIGTVAGLFAAVVVASTGVSLVFADLGFRGQWPLISILGMSGFLGLLFDSLLGATLERRGAINNDAVNFLSTLSASLFAFAGMAILAGFQAS
jgi:uncharacterized protein (TIGR00297 family)